MAEQSAKGERYVALGDSYTIGEGADPDQAWPSLLTGHLRRDGVTIDLVANPAVTGWTTAQLIEHELPVLETSLPTFATLLIGVNDWVQGVPAAEFGARLAEIVTRTRATLADARRLLLVTIPDFSVTPEGSGYGRGRDIAAGIAGFNGIVRAEAARASLPVVDIYPLSQTLTDAKFIAADGLHPSAAAYARWEELIHPAARKMLEG